MKCFTILSQITWRKNNQTLHWNEQVLSQWHFSWISSQSSPLNMKPIWLHPCLMSTYWFLVILVFFSKGSQTLCLKIQSHLLIKTKIQLFSSCLLTWTCLPLKTGIAYASLQFFGTSDQKGLDHRPKVLLTLCS